MASDTFVTFAEASDVLLPDYENGDQVNGSCNGGEEDGEPFVVARERGRAIGDCCEYDSLEDEVEICELESC